MVFEAREHWKRGKFDPRRVSNSKYDWSQKKVFFDLISQRNDQLLQTNSPISRILRPCAWNSRLAIDLSSNIFWDDVLGDDVVMSRMHLWNYNGR